jgi:putative peptide zinc metalloprotease protein
LERPTFSPFWHRLAATTPRLRPHVQITRQFYRGRRWHVAHDPTSNQFYRLSPIGYEFISLLDGATSVEKAWTIALNKHGDSAPTQHEVIELISQLYNSNLLSVEASPETEQLLRRGRERTRKRLVQQAIGLLYFRMPLLNPDRFLTAVEPIFRPVLNRFGLILWAIFVLAVLANLLPQWPRLVSGIDSITSPQNWLWMIAVFIFLKLWHELGHGVMCKTFGGQVPEFGAMLLVLIPSPYVDASSAWSFDGKWKRIAVGAGGMMFELFAAAIAGIIWLNATPGTLPSSLAYFVMVTSGVSTLVFNANPLMKFDGYYMLSDYLEVPNMQQRSGQLIKNFFIRTVYGVENVRPVTNQPSERWILFWYGWLSMGYRALIIFSISFWLLGQWFGLGLVLAIWSIGTWALLPTGKLIHYLASNSQLHDRRARAIGATLAIVLAIAGILGLVRVPDWRRAPGVVESTQQSPVFAGTDGFIDKVHVRPGQTVTKGQLIVELISPQADLQIAAAEAEKQEYAVRLAASRAQGDAAGVLAAEKQIAAAQQQIAELRRQRDELRVLAPQDGVVVGSDPMEIIGALVRRGEMLCQITQPGSLRIAAVLEQGDASALFDQSAGSNLQPDTQELQLAADATQIRIRGRASELITPINTRVQPAGLTRLPHASLGFAGGGPIAVNNEDQSGKTAEKPRFVIKAELTPQDQATLYPGQRVVVRMTLPGKSIMNQAWDRFRKLLQGRVDL